MSRERVGGDVIRAGRGCLLENCWSAGAHTPGARTSESARAPPEDARRGTHSASPARPKLVVNDPTLRSPTVTQISATLWSVLRSSSAARSSRRVSRYWCGVSPKARRNSRLKWAGKVRGAGESRDVGGRAVTGVDKVGCAQEVPGRVGVASS